MPRTRLLGIHELPERDPAAAIARLARRLPCVGGHGLRLPAPRVLLPGLVLDTALALRGPQVRRRAEANVLDELLDGLRLLPRNSYASPTDTTPARAEALNGSGPFSTAAARATEARDTPISSPARLNVTSPLSADSRLPSKARCDASS